MTRLPLPPRAAALMLAMAVALLPAPARPAQPLSGGPLVVGTSIAPPFVFRDDQGELAGISIALWDQLAARLGLETRFEERTLPELIDGTADGTLDAAIAAITISEPREARIDFTHPYHTTGYGIAVAPPEQAGLLGLLLGLVSWEFLQVVGVLALLLLAVGTLAWIFERRRNPAQFGPGVGGIGDGFWWSAVTMTTVGYGDKAPVTPGGRAVALVWMFAGLIIISSFTAAITTSLTASRLQGTVQSVHDLPKVRVAAPGGSTASEHLRQSGVAHGSYRTTREGLQALAEGRIDAFVSDAPILQYLARTEYAGRAEVLGDTFGRQDYGIALPPGSPLREPLNRAILEMLGSPEWRRLLRAYLGD